MTIIPIPFFYPGYIKKEDAKESVKGQRKMVGSVLLVGILVIGIVEHLVSSKLLNLFKDLGQPVPAFMRVSLPITIGMVVVFGIIAAYYHMTPPNYARLEKELSQYKEGEMIRVNKIMDMKYVLLVLVLLGLAMGFMILSSVVPIYQLTSSY